MTGLVLFLAAPRQPQPSAEVAVEEPAPVPDAVRLGLSERREQAELLAKAGMPVRMADPEHPHVAYLVSPDITSGMWNRTTLVDDEPFEAVEYEAPEIAFYDALAAGGVPTEIPAPPPEAPGWDLDREDVIG